MGDVNESRDTLQDREDLKKETALAGYQAAISLWAYQGDQVWARFNIMLVANSIFVAAITLSNTFAYAKSLPILGFILCIFWFILMKRESKYTDYYINSARELEEQYLAPLGIVSKGALLAEGREVTLKIDGKDEPFQMDCWARLCKAKTISYLVILLFGLLYFWLLFHPFVITESFIDFISHPPPL